MTPDLAALAERHVEVPPGDGICATDGDPWPCDARVLLDALDEARAALEYERGVDGRTTRDLMDLAASLEAERDAARADAARLAVALRDLTHGDRCDHRWCEVGREALRLHDEATG